MKLFRIFLFTSFTFFVSNFLLYLFNLTDYLLIKELVFHEDIFINTIILVIYSLLAMLIITILYNRITKHLKDLRIMFINNAIWVIIILFFLKIILKNDKLDVIENNISLIFTLFLTTYVFYYSIYYLSLLKYIGNKK